MSVPQGRQLIDELLTPGAYRHSVDQIQLIETHISWVILTGSTAYKIKKPIELDFLDFSTLEKRSACCQKELRLNRRLAPALYQAVVPVTVVNGQVAMDGEGEPIEYAVKMKEFQQSQLLSHAVETGRLLPGHIDSLAATVADFHARVDVAEKDSVFGEPSAVLAPVMENFEELRTGGLSHEQLTEVERLSRWSEHSFQTLQDQIRQRKDTGYVRECHGDMHLGNMILDLNGDDPDGGGLGVTVFDCIEFNDYFRWIDVISEVAFCVMDLEDRGRKDYAYRFLNAYLEHTGDYSGVGVLRFYLVYYAMVRAKVARIRIAQEQAAGEVEPSLLAELDTYLHLAHRYTASVAPRLLITHGVSGSGKTYGTQKLLESQGAVRIRSDIERKRLLGEPRPGEGFGEGIYSEAATEQVYQHLQATAASVLDAGHTVVVDATFLNPHHRELFRQLAADKCAEFCILSFRASLETLQQRVVERQKQGQDASDATLEILRQQQTASPNWTDSERPHIIEVDSESDDSVLESLDLSVSN